jgi:hypothetical protein
VGRPAAAETVLVVAARTRPAATLLDIGVRGSGGIDTLRADDRGKR